MSEHRKSSFDDHLNLVKTANLKTVAGKPAEASDLLSKLAAELGLEKKAEGATVELNTQKTEANATPAGANPAVVAATEQLATPQVVLAGGNPAESAAGEVPAQAKPAGDPIISSGTGDAQTAQTLNKTDEAVAAAARGTGGAGETGPLQSAAVAQQGSEAEKTAAEATRIGQIIAKSFQETLEKQAADQEYAQALGILKQAGALDNYDIKDEPQMTKVASTDGLEKIAANQPLTRQDIISAAYELLEQEKVAADAEEEGRADARAFAALLTKVAEDAKAEAKAEGESENQEKAEKEKKPEEKKEDEKEESEKMAALMKNPAIVGAVKILRQNDLI